jgi:CRP-like cAMP-binding protein
MVNDKLAAWLTDVGHPERLMFARGERLFVQGSPADKLYLLKQGAVKLVRGTIGVDACGLDVVFSGEFFGRTALTAEAAFTATAVALQPGEAHAFSSPALTGLLRGNAEAALEAAELLGRRADRLEWMRSLALKPVRQRVIELLIDLTGRGGPELPLTHRDLAELAGVRIETMIRALSALQREGFLNKARGRIALVRRAL